MAREVLEFEDAKIIFRNFEGRQQKFNPLGKRNFCLVLNENDVEDFIREGWNVKETKPREEGDPIKHYVKINVNMESKNPPKIYMIAGRHKTELTADTVKELDYASIKQLDIVVSPWKWHTDDGGEGISGYLQPLYAEIIQDSFADKWNAIGEEEEEEVPFN